MVQFCRLRRARNPARNFLASHFSAGWLFFPPMARVKTTPSCAATCRQAVLLLTLALIPAIFAAWLHPKRPEWSWKRPAVTELTLSDAESLSPPVLWVDARPDEEYNARHIPGAISLNEDRWEELLAKFMAVWQPGARVIVYCNSQRCDASREVAARLRHELQIGNVFVLQGGWNAWLEAQKK
jgi:rhodanese-related sulfurtransferase